MSILPELNTNKEKLNNGIKITNIKVIIVLILFLAFIFSYSVGRFPVKPGLLAKVLASKILPITKTWSDTVETVVFQVRLPRILAAMLVGASLAASGAAYQGMFKNPLVSPDILGASSGAAFGAALAISLSFNVIGIQLMSFFMGLMAVLFTYFLSSKAKYDPIVTLVLIGILVSTIFTSGVSLLKYVADPYDKLPTITFWLMGSLSSVTLRDVALCIIPIMLGAVPLFMIRWRLNVLSIGEDEAKALGLNTNRLRILVVLCSTLMTAASVSICGLIGWVGLIIPHLARLLVGPNYKHLLPVCFVIGGTYLLLVDDIARTLTSVEIPLSVLTSIIGAPFFIYLFVFKRRQLQ